MPIGIFSSVEKNRYLRRLSILPKVAKVINGELGLDPRPSNHRTGLQTTGRSLIHLSDIIKSHLLRMKTEQ